MVVYTGSLISTFHFAQSKVAWWRNARDFQVVEYREVMCEDFCL